MLIIYHTFARRVRLASNLSAHTFPLFAMLSIDNICNNNNIIDKYAYDSAHPCIMYLYRDRRSTNLYDIYIYIVYIGR